jgi:hypothetical protein
MLLLNPGKTIVLCRTANQADSARFSDGCLLPPLFQEGGSLAGNDSRDASSTISNVSSPVGGSSASIGKDRISWRCTTMVTVILPRYDSKVL